MSAEQLPPTPEVHGEALKANAIYDALLKRRKSWYQKYRPGKVAPEVAPKVAKRYKRQAVRLVEAAEAPVNFSHSLKDKGYTKSTVKRWEQRVDLATRALQDKKVGEVPTEAPLPVVVAKELPKIVREEPEGEAEPIMQERPFQAIAIPSLDEPAPVAEAAAPEPPPAIIERAPVVQIVERRRGWDFVGKACGAVVKFGKNVGRDLQGIGRQKVKEWAPVVTDAWNKLTHPEKKDLEWVVSFLGGAGLGLGASVVGAKVEISPLMTNLCKGASGAILGAGGLGLRRLSESEKVGNWISQQEQSNSRIARMAGKVAAKVASEDTSRVMIGAGLGLVAETGGEVLLRSIGQLGGWQTPQPEVTQAVPTSTPIPTGREIPVQPPPSQIPQQPPTPSTPPVLTGPPAGGLTPTLAEYTVKSGDTVSQILQHFGADPYGPKLTQFVVENAQVLAAKGLQYAEAVNAVKAHPDWVARGGGKEIWQTIMQAVRLINPGDVLKIP